MKKKKLKVKIAIPKKGEQLTSVIKPLKTKSKRLKSETETERDQQWGFLNQIIDADCFLKFY